MTMGDRSRILGLYRCAEIIFIEGVSSRKGEVDNG